eukprot:GGOE01017921.1.p1 GENE.GGOE01017921.1~~GGOE01017921.1.p1  ORF type:complete len:1164 (-),score=272.01 GGOE01017921.1:276-3608(-)
MQDHAEHLLDSSGGPILCFVAVAFVIGIVARRWVRAVPYTVQLFVYGLLLGQVAVMLPHHHQAEAFIGVSVAEMHPKLMMALFLPILLFEGAFFVHLSVFSRVSGPAALLAGPGCLFTTAFIAVATKYLYPDWSWANAALLGVIISPTDPISMLDALKEVGACKRTSSIIEGEDLLNDASAILMFDVLMDYHHSGDLALSSNWFTRAGWLLAGGPIFGWLCGRCTTFILRRSFNDALVEATATLAGAFLCYYIAEVFLDCSGVLSIVTYGLVLNFRRSNISPEVQHFIDHFWHIVIFFAKTLIFIVEGIHTRLALSSSDSFDDFGPLLLLFLTMNISRFIIVFLFLPLFNTSRGKMDWRHAFLISFAGIRGDVPLALVTLVSTMGTASIPGHVEKLLTFHVGGLVMLSILFNGLLSTKVIRALGISDVPAHRRVAMQRALHTVTQENDRYARMLQGDPVLADAPWDFVEYQTADKLAYPWPRLPPEDLSPEERLEMSRVQVMRTLRIEIWRMHHDGLARQATIRRLSFLTDDALNDGMSLPDVAWYVSNHLMDLKRTGIGFWLSKLFAMCSLPYERNRSVYSAYDAGFAFVQALQAVQEHLHHLCADAHCVDELKCGILGALSIVRQRLQELDVEYPKVTQSMKLRGAARLLLNADRQAVQAMMHHGLIEEDDGELLIHRIERYMVRLKSLPITMSLCLPEQVLSATGWFQNLTTTAQARLLACGTVTVNEKDCIQPLDSLAQGLGLVVHGVVRVVPNDSEEAWFLGPGQALNVFSVICGDRTMEGLYAQSSRVTFYWFPLAEIQKVLEECPKAKRDLVRAMAVRLCTHTLSRYLPYALWGKAKVMAAAERGWLMNLHATEQRHEHSTPVRERTGSRMSHHSTSMAMSRASGFSTGHGVRRIISSGSLAGPGSGVAVDFPRPQQVLPGDAGHRNQVMVGMVPQYEYVLLHGSAVLPDFGRHVHGPCVLHNRENQPEPLSLPDALVMDPTWIRVNADAWIVALPKYDEVEDGEEEDDDPRGSPLAGGRDQVDYAMDNASVDNDAPHSTLVSYVTRLLSPRDSRDSSEDGSRAPLLDNLGRWRRTSRRSSHDRHPSWHSSATSGRKSHGQVC